MDAEEGGILSKHIIHNFYQYIAQGISNLKWIFDPEAIYIGGGITNRKQFLGELNEHLFYLGIDNKKFKIDICHFKNNAGLVGALYHHIHAKN
ncbi:ROK family protein [Scopulibacillus darangshiensis]|uniref:ROK family protein n=1 Tax=Scopulibacillus darangshiensis TaxID=442528 RepID=A0A4R2N8D6_9BACL|nr:ROK family protein [Scopulibacillus darangshiensis]